MSGQRSPRGLSTSLAASRSNYALRDSIPFPSGSYSSSEQSFEPLHVSNALLDVLRVAGAVALIIVTASAFFIGPFFLFFCRLP